MGAIAEVSLVSNKDEVLKAKAEDIERALETIGLVAERYAKGYAPVDTGRLRNSISHDVSAEEQAVYVGTNVEYAPYQEFGTRYQGGTPFLRPALDNHLGEYKSIAESELKNA